MPATSNAGIIAALERVERAQVEQGKKLDSLAESVTIHHTMDLEKCAKLDKLTEAIFGDGNGKKGMRRELDEVLRVVETWKRAMWIVITAALGAAVSAISVALTK